MVPVALWPLLQKRRAGQEFLQILVKGVHLQNCRQNDKLHLEAPGLRPAWPQSALGCSSEIPRES